MMENEDKFKLTGRWYLSALSSRIKAVFVGRELLADLKWWQYKLLPNASSESGGRDSAVVILVPATEGKYLEAPFTHIQTKWHHSPWGAEISSKTFCQDKNRYFKCKKGFPKDKCPQRWGKRRFSWEAFPVPESIWVALESLCEYIWGKMGSGLVDSHALCRCYNRGLAKCHKCEGNAFCTQTVHPAPTEIWISFLLVRCWLNFLLAYWRQINSNLIWKLTLIPHRETVNTIRKEWGREVGKKKGTNTWNGRREKIEKRKMEIYC